MNPRLRLMVAGRPKAGKTGMIAELLNKGFKVGLLDFDGNADPLYVYAKDALDRLSVIPCRDILGRQSDGTISFKDEPTAFSRAHRAIDDWGKVDPEHPWGPVRTWGPDTVLVADSLTGMGDASLNLILFLNNKRMGHNMRDSDWGSAMRNQDQWLARLMSAEFKCHMLITVHVKLIGPRPERSDKNEDPDLVSAKAAISAANAELIPTRYYPTALGRALPQEITRRVPAAVYVQAEEDGKRRIYLRAPKEVPIDIGVPGLDGKAWLEHPKGIVEIMAAVTGLKEAPKQETENAQ